MQGPSAIERSQKKLFASLKNDLALFEKRKNREIAAYERSFHRSLPRRVFPAQKRDLLRAIARASVVLVGDFHPFRQSQKGFLRLIDEAAHSCARPVIGLECLQQEHQPALNDYLARTITLEELREEIEFERHWPFSWESYKEILAFARERKIPVLALNIREKKRNTRLLRTRDKAAAERVAQEISDQPGSVVFVLYGELHLASSHLPSDLRQKLGKGGKSVLVVHQNEPKLYWQAPRLKNGQKPEILRLNAEEYCILNSVPWVKLRSYLDWLEGSPDQESEELPDLAGSVHNYAALLAEACSIECRIRDDVEVLGPEHLAGKKAPALSSVKPAERALIQHSLRLQRTNFLPHARIILLPTASTNALFEAASYLLWHSVRQASVPPLSPAASARVGHFLVGYFGSKVLNPKRKCNELQDLREILSRTAGSPKQKVKSRVIRRALGILGPLLGPKVRLPNEARALQGAAEVEACRLAGFVLGERFFQALLKDPSLLALAHQWFQAADIKEIEELLVETAEEIGRSPSIRKKDKF